MNSTRSKRLGVPFGKKAQRFGVRFGGEINGGAPLAKQRSEAANMIGVFVGDDDAVEPVDSECGRRGKAPQRFALAQAGIHQEARPGSLEQGAVARTARRENAYAKTDEFSLGLS